MAMAEGREGMNDRETREPPCHLSPPLPDFASLNPGYVVRQVDRAFAPN